MKFRRCIVACLAAGLLLTSVSSATFASKIDVNKELMKRFIESGAADRVRDWIIKTQPSCNWVKGGKLIYFNFCGKLESQGMKFKHPDIPKTPLILGEDQVRNCKDETIKYTFEVDKETKKSSSWTNTTTLSITVSVEAETPFVSGGVESELSSSSEHTKSVEETVTWKKSLEVPCDGHKLTTMQFSVSEEKVDVDYWADFIVKDNEHGFAFTLRYEHKGKGADTWMINAGQLEKKYRILTIHGTYKGVTAVEGRFNVNDHDITCAGTEKGKFTVKKLSEDELKRAMFLVGKVTRPHGWPQDK